jgi:tRNA-Thr(GGU) m(6)t(6)A37 methyltransferase TsaA
MYRFAPIGTLRTCFKEKFGVPRQSRMIGEARGVIRLRPDPALMTAITGLDGFSHLWVIFVFDRNGDKGWRPTVEPPRIEAPPRVGVFASRSPHRPNPIGMSALKIDRIDRHAPDGVEIHVSGVDILDETPVLDLKPYLPYADAIPGAAAGWAEGRIRRHEVTFSAEARRALELRGERDHPRLERLLTEMLEWDPRPRSQRSAARIGDPESEGRRFAFRLFELDVQWEIRAGAIRVRDLVPLAELAQAPST